MHDDEQVDEIIKFPDQILDVSDPGDDTGSRFRYQHCYAALLAIKIVSEDSNVSEVICENHEDILLKLKSDKFVAVQVKTRRPDQPPFKATDSSITKSLKRFIHLNVNFPVHGELVI